MHLEEIYQNTSLSEKPVAPVKINDKIRLIVLAGEDLLFPQAKRNEYIIESVLSALKDKNATNYEINDAYLKTLSLLKQNGNISAIAQKAEISTSQLGTYFAQKAEIHFSPETAHTIAGLKERYDICVTSDNPKDFAKPLFQAAFGPFVVQSALNIYGKGTISHQQTKQDFPVESPEFLWLLQKIYGCTTKQICFICATPDQAQAFKQLGAKTITATPEADVYKQLDYLLFRTKDIENRYTRAIQQGYTENLAQALTRESGFNVLAKRITPRPVKNPVFEEILRTRGPRALFD